MTLYLTYELLVHLILHTIGIERCLGVILKLYIGRIISALHLIMMMFLHVMKIIICDVKQQIKSATKKICDLDFYFVAIVLVCSSIVHTRATGDGMVKHPHCYGTEQQVYI